MRRTCGRGFGYGPSPHSSISPVSYQPTGDAPLPVQSEGLPVEAVDMDDGPAEDVVDEAVLLSNTYQTILHAETGALAIANSHLQSIEEELRAHRDLISREVEARRLLEDALMAERRRAEVEAQGRRKLEQEIEAEKQRVEDERRRKIEEAEMAARLDEEKRLEEELEAARRRAEEEARLAAQRTEDLAAEQRRQAEKRRQLQEMEMKARESAAEAKKERESREKAKAFLAAEGYRHVRAAHKWCPVATYPLHRAVQCNDPAMVRLLLWMGADPAKSNTFGQSPLGLAKWMNRRDSHAEVIEALQTGAAR
eukprot:g17835.t1